MDEKIQEKTEEEKTEESKTSKTEDAEKGSTDGTATEGVGKTPLEQAEEINKKKEELLEREEKLLERKEKLEASRMVGGRSQGSAPTEQLSKEEQASRERVKAIGKATGAKWADDMDKKDGN